MDITKENEKREEFRKILFAMATNQELLKEGSMRSSIYKRLENLYDHVSLDIARITYSDAADRSISQQESIMSIQSKVINLESQIKDAENQLEETERKINNSQREYITILGIFASIVLAFTGGMVFSTSVLENISDGSIYRLVAVACIIGIVFVNMIWILVNYLSHINKTKNEKYKENGLKMWIGVNIILLFIIVLMGIGCINGWFDSEMAVNTISDQTININ